MMASPDPELPRTPEKKNKSYKNPLVLQSLSHALESSLPVALSDNTPTSPVQQKKASKMKLPYLLRPLSPRSRRKSDSDDSPVSPIRWHSPHPRKRKPRVRGIGQPRSADNSPGRDYREESTPPFDEFETTQTLSLPGQKENRIEEGLRTLEVPTILVSPDEEDGGLVRKTSQSSHLSATSSIITSGHHLCSKLYVSIHCIRFFICVYMGSCILLVCVCVCAYVSVCVYNLCVFSICV